MLSGEGWERGRKGWRGAQGCTPLPSAPASAAAAPEVPRMGSITVLGTAAPEPAFINGLFIKHPDQNAFIRHPGNLITQPGFNLAHPHAFLFRGLCAVTALNK